jgi:hypothetical protein
MSETEMQIEITAEDGVPTGQLHDVRRLVSSLADVTPEPPVGVRLTLRGGPKSGNATPRLYVADASLPYQGRLLAAHAAARTVLEAADAAITRLRRQIRRVRGAEIALRNEPRVIGAALEDLVGDERPRPARLKPPEERQIVHRRTFAQEPEPTLTAVADLLDDDEQFHLFVHVRTGEDVVVYWRDDQRIGLLHPQGSVLADEGDIIVTRPSRYSEPLTLAQARGEMDVLDHRFLYFADADDDRGKVIYLRFDGDYGLVEPPPA